MHNLDQNNSSSNFFQYISKNQLKKTNVYCTREDFLLENLKQKSRIAEIGTLAGDFAYHILTEYNPEYLLLVDIFGEEDVVVYVTKIPPKKRFSAATHKDCVFKRFKN